MSIHTNIKPKIAEAMKARDEVRLSVLRGLSSAFTNELVAKKKSTNEALTDDEALIVVRRQVNQRKDSIEQFEKGGRKDLVNAEKAECAILEAFLPAQMRNDEIRKIAKAKKTALNISDKSKIGILVGAVLKETKGRAEGAAVKAVVEKLFA
ncbi:MAG: hypothetical protein A3C08_02475 [Candidatus Taylorbacteria bacterium RIFCSPHIGHO2_02_FULL_47_18]|uniref:Glutamyl-tRNA amidotransferase n=1 Tax=Candidatus Taylorbacteria bacterium RIFCSPLOWO2_01_FULL_48_100 TaxID=1802322 RepID=A0A1G2ND50_9BACT|nr:MAG: hypothetical protein A2670_03205 [Candidatus Taylorbacteria bacterium RIFCSPHIGHO2_01_FULL_48_38]OHA27569.1 MAG: hypothetical protein A3C08_02475 [Candidatus Taylorbacteria bacterium RIFCSPHIGHO2_02_FULL_47_18]OHA34004.1 MAG: hypothetical protein A2938_02445 [Candidatus Taylorbacteria bacterium RIFCSPLOWO2_01_FULL_48_100]OHA40416.1 MAG: hypothetical protein A3J31_02495 [Candidatus Taylorbacteria bacterium RIFCSPLOWO2_02_FULL_48_16]OHA44944.1 MAG: hypothetical protein A3H13_03530 [Candid